MWGISTTTVTLVFSIIHPSTIVLGQQVVSDRETSRLPVTEEAEYSCRFINHWSSVDHPNLYPDDAAHWSPPVIAAHRPDYEMWAPGELASPGIERVAETGSTLMLRSEFFNQPIGAVMEIIGESQFNNVQQEQTLEDTLIMTPDAYLLSAISMIAPSPDWFSGFNNIDMRQMSTQSWVRSITVTTMPYDAGTEMGNEYDGDNDPEDPHVPIFQLTVDTLPPTNVFLDPTNTTVLPVAEWDCQLTNEPSCLALTESCAIGIQCCTGICGENGVCTLSGRPGDGTNVTDTNCGMIFDDCIVDSDDCCEPFLCREIGLRRVPKCTAPRRRPRPTVGGGLGRGGAAGNAKAGIP